LQSGDFFVSLGNICPKRGKRIQPKMENQDTPTPSDSIRAKIEAAKPDLAVAAGAGGTDSFITRVLHLLLELLPDMVDLFHSPKSASGGGGVAATTTAAAGQSAGQGSPGGGDGSAVPGGTSGAVPAAKVEG
jgi:hypothetical protein